MEPINGCTLAAANQREVLRARAYLHPAIPTRLLALHYAGAETYHAALVYHLPEGWCAYDDTFGTRQLHVSADATGFPPPLLAARAASPGQIIDAAHWFNTMPRSGTVASANTSTPKSALLSPAFAQSVEPLQRTTDFSAGTKDSYLLAPNRKGKMLAATSVEEIKQCIAALPANEQGEVSVFLSHLQHTAQSGDRTRLSAKPSGRAGVRRLIPEPPGM